MRDQGDVTMLSEFRPLAVLKSIVLRLPQAAGLGADEGPA